MSHIEIRMSHLATYQLFLFIHNINELMERQQKKYSFYFSIE
jgi:hypothetical protein